MCSELGGQFGRECGAVGVGDVEVDLAEVARRPGGQADQALVIAQEVGYGLLAGRASVVLKVVTVAV